MQGVQGAFSGPVCVSENRQFLLKLIFCYKIETLFLENAHQVTTETQDLVSSAAPTGSMVIQKVCDDRNNL